MTTGDSSPEHDPLLDAEALISLELFGLLPTPDEVIEALGSDERVFVLPPIPSDARILYDHMLAQAFSGVSTDFELDEALSLFLREGRLGAQLARPEGMTAPVGVELRIELSGRSFRFPLPVSNTDGDWVFVDLGTPEAFNALVEPVRRLREEEREASIEVRFLIIDGSGGEHDDR